MAARHGARNRGKIAQGARWPTAAPVSSRVGTRDPPWLFGMVGDLCLLGWLGPHPGCLWWGKALCGSEVLLARVPGA